MKEFKGYHGANQAVPSIDPELMQDSNAKLSEISDWGDYSEATPAQLAAAQKKVNAKKNKKAHIAAVLSGVRDIDAEKKAKKKAPKKSRRGGRTVRAEKDAARVDMDTSFYVDP
tara:strand:- start:89 stop:430 length:342 start_codon:yes stop_codon:yes gene_type:complete